ncbi:MAG: phosphotransferase [Patescibacteria group bacterium]
MITFKNQPKLSEAEVDQKLNDRRIALIPHIQNFLETNKLFKNKEVTLEFSHKGVSSQVCFLEVADINIKYVLKIPLTNADPDGNEAVFLSAWESVGVKVPHVYEYGKISDRPYILMEFVDAPLLTDAKEFKEIKDLPFEQGKILRQMHTAKAHGFGRIKNSKPEFETFKEWILSDDMKERINYVKEHNLLGDEHGPIDDVLTTLIAYTEKYPESTYCHFDYGGNNMLATNPLTIIDPDPMVTNGIIDIGRSMLLLSSGGYYDGAARLKAGYFGTDAIDEKALKSAIVVNAYWKFPYWHKKNKLVPMSNVQKYLAQS